MNESKVLLRFFVFNFLPFFTQKVAYRKSRPSVLWIQWVCPSFRRWFREFPNGAFDVSASQAIHLPSLDHPHRHAVYCAQRIPAYTNHWIYSTEVLRATDMIANSSTTLSIRLQFLRPVNVCFAMLVSPDFEFLHDTIMECTSSPRDFAIVSDSLVFKTFVWFNSLDFLANICHPFCVRKMTELIQHNG